MNATQDMSNQHNLRHNARSKALLVIPVLITLISALGYYIYYANLAPAIAEFQAKFTELEKAGEEIQNITHITLIFAPYFGLLFLISLVPCVTSIVKHSSNETKHKLLWLYNGIGAAIPYLLPIWLLYVTYLPILSLEAK